MLPLPHQGDHRYLQVFFDSFSKENVFEQQAPAPSGRGVVGQMFGRGLGREPVTLTH